MDRQDSSLVAGTLAGDAQAFEALVKRYQKLVFNIVYHYLGKSNEVEDLAQEVFLRVYRTLDRFDPSRPLKAWIGRIAANACLDELRRRKTRKVSSFGDLSEDEENRVRFTYDLANAGSLTRVEAEESFEFLRSAMAELGDKDRMAFVLREMEGLEYPEIADMMDASQVAVRIRVSRARKRLQSRVRAMLTHHGIAS